MRRHLKHVAGAIFLLSFFLPAYRPDREAYSGWECLKFCLCVFGGGSAEDAWRFYYFGFAITNFLFLLIWYLAANGSRLRSMCAWLSLLPLAHVVSWFILNFLNREPREAISVDYGYFTWLSAFSLLSASLFIGRNENGA